MRRARLFLGQRARQFGQVDADDAAHILEPLQREILAREHALDARLAQVQLGRDLRVGHAVGLETALEQFD